ncbi:MAG TPA: protein-methionine-sulfoxide reductase heme-binding subunit MsrQ [Rhodobacteraceae bacterium]|nr:protein-methionine-sulfoxide reductase heme-binding subunit MsrQ [Paracoccaceae bacterium]
MTASQTINGQLRRVPTWLVYIAGVFPVVWFFYLGFTGGLGPEPIKALEQELGRLSLQVLIAVLAVTPLRKYTGISLLNFRRALGLLVFFYVVVHLSVWLFLDVQIWSQIWADIVKRPYITIGMAGLLLMVPLAITSNNLSMRKLGAATWRKLHKLTYVVAVLGAVHFVILRKGWQVEPLIYLTIIALLLATRYVRLPKRQFA